MRRGNRMNLRGISLAASAWALAAGLVACAPTNQFSSVMRYGNLLSPAAAADARSAARAQLLERADAAGLEPEHVSDSLLRFRMQAPDYATVAPDGSVQTHEDPRVVLVEARFDDTLGENVYRYSCRVRGTEPPGFSDENRARFGLALVALREVFETPIQMQLEGAG